MARTPKLSAVGEQPKNRLGRRPFPWRTSLASLPGRRAGSLAAGGGDQEEGEGGRRSVGSGLGVFWWFFGCFFGVFFEVFCLLGFILTVSVFCWLCLVLLEGGGLVASVGWSVGWGWCFIVVVFSVLFGFGDLVFF